VQLSKINIKFELVKLFFIKIFFSWMEQRLLSYKSSQINYYRFGGGPKPVCCFHGYGEDGLIYSFLEKFAGDQYCFYAFDLPFHGQTDWKEGLLFTHKDLQQIIDGMLLQNDSQRPTVNGQLSLLGFSLGGRIALSLYQSNPAMVGKMLLLAPDGLTMNPWYWFATQTSLGNRVFSFTLKHPGWFFGFLRLLNKLRLVNPSVFKFVNHYIGDSEVRSLLYSRWTSLRKLKPNLARIKTFIHQHSTAVRLIYGEHDRIILPKRGEKFREGIENHCRLRVIKAGHQVLHEKHADEIINALSQ
jgi:pimeloyl-ACP methyl ester carboxylesterase